MPDSFAGRVSYAALCAVALAVADAALVQWTATVVSPAYLIAQLLGALVLMLALALVAEAGSRLGGGRQEILLLIMVVGYHGQRLYTFPGDALSVVASMGLVAAVVLPPLVLFRFGAGRRALLGSACLAGVLLVVAWLLGYQESVRYTPGRLLDTSRWVGHPLRVSALVVVTALAGALGIGLVRDAPRLRPRDPLFAFGGGVLLLAASFLMAPGFPGPAHSAALPTAPPRSGDLQGVVVVVMDTVRADHTSAYGYEWPTTPTLEELARNGSLYWRAWAPSPWSLPSHASLLTGLLPHEHGARRSAVSVEGGRDLAQAVSRPLGPHYVTLPERLGEAGIASAMFGANHGYLAAEYGLTRGFHHVRNEAKNHRLAEGIAEPWIRRLPGGLRDPFFYLAASVVPGDLLADRAGRWIARLGERPFFVLVNLMDAHPPTRGMRFRERYPEVAADDQRDGSVREYDLGIRAADQAIADLVGHLREAGVWERTLVIVTSDHGETFDGSGSAHGVSLRESEVRIPLVIRGPGVAAGRVEQEEASLADVPATVLRAFDLEVPERPWSRPLPADDRPVILQNWFSWTTGGAPSLSVMPGARLFEERPTTWGLVEGDWKLLLGSDGRAELHALEGLQDRPVDDPERRAALEARLRELIGPDALELRVESPEAGPGREALERLRALGYVR